MFFRLNVRANTLEETLEASDALRKAVARHLSEGDADTVAIVGAVAGLLALAAHADGQLSEAELEEIRAQLSRVHGLDRAGVDAICELLAEHGRELVVEGIQPCARVLRERTERSVRIEVLDVLMDVAAADGVVCMAETNLLRRICAGLGLSDGDYLASQDRYRHRLSVLR